jgi:hypothetical protein
MDDSDDSIGRMIAKAGQKNLQEHDLADNSDDSSDENENETCQPALPWHTNRKRKGADLLRGKKLSLIQKRQTPHCKETCLDADTSDDSDSNTNNNNDNKVEIQATIVSKPVIDIPSSSDDDKNDLSKTSLLELQKNGANPESLQNLAKARRTMNQLAQRSRLEERENNLNDPKPLASPPPDLNLTLCPTLAKAGTSHALPATVSINMANHCTVQELIDSFFVACALPKDKYTVGLKFNKRTLDPKRTLNAIPSLHNHACRGVSFYRGVVRHSNHHQ